MMSDIVTDAFVRMECAPGGSGNTGSDGCNDLDSLPLAMAYVPFQKWETPYEGSLGLQRGTIFPSLDLPFIGEEAVPRGK